MKTIMITGANGYIGRHVVKAFDCYDSNVIAVDVHDMGANTNTRFIKGDLFSSSDSIFKEAGKIDACLHLAWRDGFNHKSHTHINDVSAHFAFLNALVEHDVPQIAVMGTMHEIGYWEGAVDESTPCNPQSLYGVAKDALRRAFFLAFQDQPLTKQWLRSYYIYGDDERSQSIFGKIYRANQEGEKKFPFTSGKNMYDFIHVDELAGQIAACMMQTDVEGIINCCTGSPKSLASQVEEYIRANQMPISLEYGVYPDRAYDSPAIWGNNEKIHTIMNGLARSS